MKKDLLEEFPEAYNVLNFPYVAMVDDRNALFVCTRTGHVRRVPAHVVGTPVQVVETAPPPKVEHIPIETVSTTIRPIETVPSTIDGPEIDLIEDFDRIRDRVRQADIMSALAFTVAGLSLIVAITMGS